MDTSTRELTSEELDAVWGGSPWTALVAAGAVIGGSVALAAAVTAATPFALVAGAALYALGAVAAFDTIYNFYQSQSQSCYYYQASY